VVILFYNLSINNDINTNGLYRIDANISRLASLILNDWYNLKLNKVSSMLPAVTQNMLSSPEIPNMWGRKLRGINTAEYMMTCIADSFVLPVFEGSN
jgi:hypothetical protein